MIYRYVIRTPEPDVTEVRLEEVASGTHTVVWKGPTDAVRFYGLSALLGFAPVPLADVEEEK